jgi:hypothetical protein
MDDFERELREAFERRPAPPSLKRRLMEQRRWRRPQGHAFAWQRMAASLALAAVLGGALAWHRAEERRKGEEARQQVLTALRITNHALNEMNARLASHDRNDQE